MSSSDPIVFAARAARMSDDELFAAIRNLGIADAPDCFLQALLDESRLRGSSYALENGCGSAP